MTEKKKGGGALLGAAFLMATLAIGPGFLTQTANFTGQHAASFGFVILASIILAAIAQMNIWRVLCTTGWTSSYRWFIPCSIKNFKCWQRRKQKTLGKHYYKW